MRLKVTKVERERFDDIKKVGNYYERTINFYNGDLCVTSIIIKAKKKEDLNFRWI